MIKPDTSHVLDNLKDFQRRTVDHVFDRFYVDDRTRFLVADEVGLGKTLVAKGIIARAIDHLWDRVDRIEIVYICSNADIARQNIDRLHIENCGIEKMPATRLSLLPLEKRDRGPQKVNFIALTPGTSFELSGGKGWARERALLYLMLRDAWGFESGKPPRLVLAAAGKERHGEKSFEYELGRIEGDPLDREITRRFNKQMRAKEAKPLRAEFADLCKTFHRSNAVVSHEDRLKRHHWIGKLRTELTRVCIESLQPSLIIMDEFQRFRDLLNEETPAGQLAADLFNYADGSNVDSARTLLLSATPYKMLFLNHEQNEDHYRDLLTTLAFLDGDENQPAWKARFGAYQQSLLRLDVEQPEQSQLVREHCDELSRHLRRVMVRTERPTEQGGMLRVREDWGADKSRRPATDDLSAAQPQLAVQQPTGKSARPTSGIEIEVDDVRAWLALQAIADELGQGDCIEYWKSAPYVLNFMDRYQLSKAFHDAATSANSSYAIYKLVAKHEQSFLPIERIENYKSVPPANARLRSLLRETLDDDAWKLLWVPPSLPHYQLAGPFAHDAARTFTKSLIFSAWHVVPKAVAALLSYEAERRMMRFAKPRGPLTNTRAARAKRRALLRFSQSQGRCTGLPLFCLVYPSLALAEMGDPARLLRETGKPMPSLKEMLAMVEQRLNDVLTPLLRDKPQHGPEDERWYWLAPMLLDQTQWPEATGNWWSHPTLAAEWMLILDNEEENAHHDAWNKHVAEAQESLAKPEQFGRPPADLARLLAQVAIASPAMCALRAFSRSEGTTNKSTRLAAGRVGHAFLSLFNIPEVRALLLGLNDEEPYWRRVLDYAGNGGLQAVLDEFTHLLCEDREKKADELSKSICEAVRLQATTLRADHITAPNGKRRVAINQPRDGQSQDDASEDAGSRGIGMRTRFARRFGDDRGETEKSGNTKEAVRNAFNSPFWPFVLVSTSVGQEGLDFHRYCHRVIHWNLPSNPVDLEQREGRVHRYKGHAVRKNLSQRHREDTLSGNENDLWRALFDAGAKARSPGDSELFPYWLFPGEAKIERCVPILPLSRDVSRLQALRRALTVYRMAFGHARQEDILEHLLARVPQERREELCTILQIDLSPPI